MTMSEQNNLPEKGKVVTARNAVGVVSGYYAMKRTAGAIKGVFSGARGIKNIVAKPERFANEADQQRLSGIHGGKEDGEKSRYAIYSHTQNMFFHSDNFSECLRAAYTQTEIAKMEADAKLMRRIHAYGAALVAVSATLITLKMMSAISLFSLFPAMMLLSFALRRGCYEETLKQQKLIAFPEYLSQRGLLALWK